MPPEPTQHIVVTVNGPGEVVGWLYPLAETLKAREPRAAITAALLPCVFASGSEQRVIERMRSVDAVVPVRETLRFLFRGGPHAAFRRDAPGCVVHLGGELWLSILLARRLGYPILAYSEKRLRYERMLDRACLDDRPGAHELRPRQTRSVVGNLMVDAVRMRVPARKPFARTSPVVGLFPGSRWRYIKHQLPFLIKVAHLVAAERPDVRWAIARSDFITSGELERAATDETGRLIEGVSARWSSPARRDRFVSDGGLEFEVGSGAEVMSKIDFAVTVPGTNTAELAILGVPMLVLFPTHKLDYLPQPGLVGHMGAIPGLGWMLKRGVAHIYLRMRPYWALPNVRAARAIVPELVARYTAADVARHTLDALRRPLEATSDALRAAMGAPGASERLVSEVLGLVAERFPERVPATAVGVPQSMISRTA